MRMSNHPDNLNPDEFYEEDVYFCCKECGADLEIVVDSRDNEILNPENLKCYECGHQNAIGYYKR